ncbi:ATP-grasp domain-containing protein [Maribacter sp. 2307UL18-2]|uniref:ATP-grasp domain-containing protein n=1 Tax=Maribacter sp. 2307UL18-2 TaxID=3386274 RepID=UPI0039BCDE5C
MVKKKTAILIPDAENYLLIHVLNCLAQIDTVTIYAMTVKHNWATYSRHIKKNTVFSEASNGLKRIESINAELLKHDIDIIMPIHDACIKDLIIYREHLINHEKIIVLPSYDVYKIVTNKGKFSAHLETYGIPAPKSGVLKTESLQEYKRFGLSFPFIIKPASNSHGGLGVVLIDSEMALQSYRDTYREFDEFVVQEYIEGDDWGCSVLCVAGELKAYSLQRTTIHEKKPFSPAIGVELVHDTRPLEMVKQLLRSLSWNGVAHIDMRYNLATNSFVIIEMNARYWASIEASMVGGINFPYLHLLVSMGKDFPLPTYRSIEYLKLKGVLYRLKKDRWSVFDFRFLRSNTELGAVCRDVMPSLFRMFSSIKKQLKG